MGSVGGRENRQLLTLYKRKSITMLSDTYALTSGTYTRVRTGEDGTLFNAGGTLTPASILVKHDFAKTLGKGINRHLVQASVLLNSLATSSPSNYRATINLTMTTPNIPDVEDASRVDNLYLDLIKFLSNGTAVSSAYTLIRNGSY